MRALVAVCIVAALGCHAKSTMSDLGCNVATGRDPRCPTMLPTDGSACDSPVYGCEYDGDSLTRNTSFAYCEATMGATALSWTVFSPWMMTAVGPESRGLSRDLCRSADGDRLVRCRRQSRL